MAKTYAQCLRDYNRKVLQSAIGSVAAVSPPSSYKAAKNAKDSSNAQKTKDAIKKLQARIYGSWNEIVQGFPAGKSKIYSPSKEYPYNHLFVLGKGKGVRAQRATNLPILSTKQAVKSWYLSNSKIQKGKSGGFVRVVNKGAVAFVSSANILRQAGKEISKSAGKFIAGWWTIFALLGKPISRYTTSQATAKATSLSSASQIHDTITASNMATDVQGVAAAAEGLISKHLPQSVQYYSKVYEKYLIKDIDKNIGIKNLTIKVKL